MEDGLDAVQWLSYFAVPVVTALDENLLPWHLHEALHASGDEWTIGGNATSRAGGDDTGWRVHPGRYLSDGQEMRGSGGYNPAVATCSANGTDPAGNLADRTGSCTVLRCAAVSNDTHVITVASSFSVVLVGVLLTVLWFMRKLDFKLSRLAFWVAGWDLFVHKPGEFRKWAWIVVIALGNLLVAPWALTLGFGFALFHAVRGCYVSSHSPALAVVAMVGVLFTVFSMSFGFLQWKYNSWLCTRTVRFSHWVGLFSFMGVWVSYYVFVYWGERALMESFFRGTIGVFLTLNFLPIVYVTFASEGSGLPVDYLWFLKNPAKQDLLHPIVEIKNARDERVNGTYKPRRSAEADGVPVYFKVEAESARERRTTAYGSGSIQRRGGGAARGGDGSAAASRDSQPGWLGAASVASSVRSGAETEAPGRESRLTDDVTIMRVRVFGAPFWVVSVGDLPRYGIRSEFATPPGGAWGAIASDTDPEGPNFCDEHEADRRKRDGPFVVVSDSLLHKVDASARVKGERAAGGLRRQFIVAQFVSVSALLAMALFFDFSGNYVGPERKVGWGILLVLVWVEIAQGLRMLAGLRLSAVRTTALNFVVRVIIVVAGRKYVFIAACVIYMLYALPVAALIAESYFPHEDAKDLLRGRLVSLLPPWMYSQSGAGATNAGSDTQQLLPHALLTSLTPNKLASLAGAFSSWYDKLRDACGIRKRLISLATISLGRRPNRNHKQGVAVLFYLSMTFGIGILLAYDEAPDLTKPIINGTHVLSCANLTTAQLDSEFPPFCVLGGEPHQQWEYGIATMGFVFSTIFFLAYRHGSKYYGHNRNACPHRNVVVVGVFAWFWSVLIVVLLWAATSVQLVLCVGVALPTLLLVGHWGYKNWEMNDYLFLQNRPVRFGVHSLRVQALRSTLRSLLPDLSMSVFKRDIGVILAVGVIQATLIMMGWAMTQNIDGKGTAVKDREHAWLIVVGTDIVGFTFVAFKAYFNTFKFPTYPVVAIAVLLSAFVSIIENGSAFGLSPAVKDGMSTIVPLVYILVVAQAAALYQAYENGFKLDWEKTKMLLYIIYIGIWFGLILLILAIFVYLAVRASLQCPVGNGCVDMTCHAPGTERDGKVCIPTGLGDPIATLIGSVWFAVLWCVHATARWASHKFRLNRFHKVVTAVIVLGVSTLTVYTTVKIAGAQSAAIAAARLSGIVVQVVLLAVAVSGLSAPDSRQRRHHHEDVFPTYRLHTVTGVMKEDTTGVAAFVALCAVAMWYSMFVTLSARPGQSHDFAVLIQAGGLVGVVAFRTYMKFSPRKRSFEAWEYMRQFPEVLYTIKQKVIDSEGVAATVKNSSAGGDGGGGSGGAAESKPDEESASYGSGATLRDVDTAATARSMSAVKLRRKVSNGVPESYPPILPLPDSVTSLFQTCASRLQRCVKSAVAELLDDDELEDAWAGFPTHYTVTVPGDELLTGVYVRNGVSDGVPMYVQYGRPVVCFLKRVKRFGGTFWVLGQPHQLFFGARVDGKAAQAASRGGRSHHRQLWQRIRGGLSSEHEMSTMAGVVSRVMGGVQSGLLSLEHSLDSGLAAASGGRIGGNRNTRPHRSPQNLVMDIPPMTSSEWRAIDQPAEDEPEKPRFLLPRLQSWEELQSGSHALTTFERSMQSMFRQDSRMVARMMVMIELAKEEQEEREKRALWTFLLAVTAELADVSPETTGTRNRSTSRAIIGDPESGHVGGLATLSAAKVEKWLDEHMEQLTWMAGKYAKKEAERRAQQRIDAERDLIMSRRQKAKTRQYRPQFTIERTLQALVAKDKTRSVDALDKLFSRGVKDEIAAMAKLSGGQFRDPKNPQFPMDPSVPYLPSSMMVYETSRGGAAGAQLYSGDPKPKDIVQGALGDCWLLSAMGILAGSSRGPRAVHDIILGHNRQLGYYVVKLYHAESGEWRRIVVDDFFPATESRGPLFGHSRDNVTWVMVLEKAMAKFFDQPSGYEVLDAGLVHDGLVAFTGGASEEIDLSDHSQVPSVTVLWHRMEHYHSKGFMMGAASPPGSDKGPAVCGIVQGHAYAILDMQEVLLKGKQLHMIKVRNPWGDNPEPEATPLDWMPGSSTWEQPGGEYMRRKLNWDPNDDPGAFWMTFEDFNIQFAAVFICRQTYKWNSLVRKGAWFGGSGYAGGGLVTTSTGQNNPQYKVTVLVKKTLFITLTQALPEGVTEYPHIMMVLFASDGQPLTAPLSTKEVEQPSFHKTGEARDQREVSMEVRDVEPGVYTLIPFTFYANVDGLFTVRVYFPKTGVDGGGADVEMSPIYPADLDDSEESEPGGGGGGGSGAATSAGSTAGSEPGNGVNADEVRVPISATRGAPR